MWMKYLGIRTSLVTMHAPWVGHTMAVGQSPRNLWRHNRQAPNITFSCTHLPGVHQSSKTNIYRALLECYYNSVLDRYWTTELHKLISTESDQSTFPWIVRTLPFIIITQPESWYSFYHPTEGRRLSRPSWLVTYRDGLPVHRRSPILVLTKSDVAQLRWSRPTRYHWAKPPTVVPHVCTVARRLPGCWVINVMSIMRCQLLQIVTHWSNLTDTPPYRQIPC